MNEAGPFVVVAAFCEKVLRELDGAVSAIRIFDSIELQSEGSDPQALPVVSLRFLLVIRCGTKFGDLKVQLVLASPSGTRAPAHRIQSSVDTPGAGMIWNVEVTTSVKETGLYWMEVSADGAGLLTRVPLRVTTKQTPPSGTGPSNS